MLSGLVWIAMSHQDEPPNGFRKKVYTKMYHSSMSALRFDQERPVKKIVPSSKMGGLREEYKKVFLPLLIDVFELRQAIRTHKNNEEPSLLSSLNKPPKTPQEILERLTELQLDIEESQRWCKGVILQISKGIEETKEALQLIGDSTEMMELAKTPLPLPTEKVVKKKGTKAKSFWKKLFRIK